MPFSVLLNGTVWPRTEAATESTRLAGHHYISARALATVAKHIKLKGFPDATSRSSLGRQRHGAVKIDTHVGRIIQLIDCKTKNFGTIKLPFLHPIAILWVACKYYPEFTSAFASILHGQRLKIIEYTDEIDPGRELIKNNDKNIWILYRSFLDFGPAALPNEGAWFTGVVGVYSDAPQITINNQP